MTCIRIPGGVMCVQPDFKPGDQAPEGYLAWHEWADTQHKAGLRQKECGRCGKWKYPQELSATVDQCEMQSRKGTVTLPTPVCNACVVPDNAGDKPPRSGLIDLLSTVPIAPTFKG